MTPAHLTRQNDGIWWSTYADSVWVWASGLKAVAADAALLQWVPWPYQEGMETAEVLTHATVETGYACYAVLPEVVSVGPTLEDAVAQLVAHVPVPQSTGGSGGDLPPTLEERPLPPVAA